MLVLNGGRTRTMASPDPDSPAAQGPLSSDSSLASSLEAAAPRDPRYANLHDVVESLPGDFLAGLSPLNIPDAIKQDLHTDTEMPINIVLVGKYQVGKSALINAMFFERGGEYEKIAPEGDELEPMTSSIKHYSHQVDGIQFRIYDTMGLQDGKKKDRRHAQEIKKIFAEAHLVLYCTKLQEPIRPDDIETLKILTKECGASFWKNAVIALTFANTASPTDPKCNKETWFRSLLEKKKEKLCECFINDLHISEEVWCRLSQHTVPVGNTLDPRLPGINDWRAEFWHVCVAACADKAKGAVAALAWKEEAFYEMLASGSVATLGTTAAAIGIALAAVGAASSATVVGLPVGVAIAVVGLAALVGGATATAVSKRRASGSSENENP